MDNIQAILNAIFTGFVTLVNSASAQGQNVFGQVAGSVGDLLN